MRSCNHPLQCSWIRHSAMPSPRYSTAPMGVLHIRGVRGRGGYHPIEYVVVLVLSLC